MKKTMAEIMPRRLAACALLLLAGLFVMPLRAESADAYVYLKGRMEPLFVTNFSIRYANSHQQSRQIIAALPYELKYIKYSFDRVRQVDFLKQGGAERSCPSYIARLQLIRTGATRRVVIMPIKEFRGTNLGAPWVYPLDSDRGYEENAANIKEIRFVHIRN